MSEAFKTPVLEASSLLDYIEEDGFSDNISINCPTINSEFNQNLRAQVEGDESIKEIFNRNSVSLMESICYSFDNPADLNIIDGINVPSMPLEKKLEPSFEDLKKNLTSTFISHVSRLVSSILGNHQFFSKTHTLIEQKEFVVDGITYRATIERVGTAKEIDAKDYMSFSFRHEVQAAKQAWVRIFEKITPTQRKITMFRAAKEMLDTADQDVEVLKVELKEKIENKKITKWVKRDTDNVELFIMNTWGRYIKAGLVNREVMRKYDITTLRELEKLEKSNEDECENIFRKKIPTVAISNQWERDCLYELGYPAAELLRLASNHSKAHKKNN